jgi:hypothetical protein
MLMAKSPSHPKKDSGQTHKPDDPEQSKRFLEAAKRAGADDTEAGAQRAFRKVVGHKPKPK